MSNYFARITGEVKYNERASVNNIHINDIVTYKNVKKIRFYCKVDNICPGKKTMNVTNLFFDGHGFILLPNDIKLPSTSNNLSFRREIYVIRNLE
jgi:hypothetical protein